MPVVKIAVACSEYLIKRDFGADFLVVQTNSQENGARSTAHSESDRAAVSVKMGPSTFRHNGGGKNGLIKKKTHTHIVSFWMQFRTKTGKHGGWKDFPFIVEE